MIKFTEIAYKLNYPAKIKSKLSAIHTDIINYVIYNFTGKLSQRQIVINTMNTVSYLLFVGDSIPRSWDSKSQPLEGLDIVDEDVCRSILGDLYLSQKQVEWDIPAVNVDEKLLNADKEDGVYNTSKRDDSRTLKMNNKPIMSHEKLKSDNSNKVTVGVRESQKSDLYLSPPDVPRFDKSKVWMSGVVNNTDYCIYTSLPIIPKVQNDISATTDISLMTDKDFLQLFPNKFIPTRADVMYNELGKIAFDGKLGLILPIKGFKKSQIIDNIIKYPHLFRLNRIVGDKSVNFFSYIELDGELYKISEVWHKLPESKQIPYQAEFIKEYVIRRYLLERDILGVKHVYPISNRLEPFLTLFMSAEDYSGYGYKDSLELARSCVNARINYKQSMNPIITVLKERG